MIQEAERWCLDCLTQRATAERLRCIRVISQLPLIITSDGEFRRQAWLCLQWPRCRAEVLTYSMVGFGASK